MEELLRLAGYLMGVTALFCFTLAWATWPGRLSPELREFLSDWYEWATSGAPHLKPFSRTEGLCVAAYRSKNYTKIARELHDILWADFGTAEYPFGRDNYIDGQRFAEQHKCPKRLAWVKKRLGV